MQSDVKKQTNEMVDQGQKMADQAGKQASGAVDQAQKMADQAGKQVSDAVDQAQKMAGEGTERLGGAVGKLALAAIGGMAIARASLHRSLTSHASLRVAEYEAPFSAHTRYSWFRSSQSVEPSWH